MGGRLLGREPVATVSTVVALLVALLPLFGWSTEVVALVAAAIVAVGGGVEAALVSVDRLLPLLVGIGKAVIAAAVGLGADIPDNVLTAGIAVLTVLAGLQVRKQVGAVQPAVNRNGRQVDRNGWPVGELTTEYADDVPPGPESGKVIRRGDFIAGETEVFGAVAADGPVPEDKSGRHHREDQAARRQRGGVFNGELGPELAT